MALEPVKIPQNVYVEDRIIGPITLKQIMIIAGGAGISYILWSLYVKSTGSASIPMTIILWIPAVISAAFAFLKVNDISLFKMILLIIEQMNKTPTRHWESGRGISINIVTRPSKDEKEKEAPKEITQSSRLAELSRQLEREQRMMLGNDNHSDEIDVKEKKTIETDEEDDIHEASAIRPVMRDRVHVDPLDQSRSVDGLGSLRGSLPFQ